MDVALDPSEAQKSLWEEYKKTDDYLKGKKKAIPERHKIVLNRERVGLTFIYKSFVGVLSGVANSQEALKARTIGEWLSQWKKMHDVLFRYVLKPEYRGNWRKKDVYFGDPANQDIHHIPNHLQVVREVSELAKNIYEGLNKDYQNNLEKLAFLAKIHYQFIRIHPFMDGNGRIGRALVDQIAMFFGFPPAVSGYPRLDKDRREKYHNAISSCAEDPSCEKLAIWIKSYIDNREETLA